MFGINGHILVNTVASHCYLSSSYVKYIGLHVKYNNDKVILTNELDVEMEGTVNVHVKIQQYQYQVSCLVIKLSDGFDLILVHNWLNKHRANINYVSKACILHKDNKKNYNSKCGNKHEEVHASRQHIISFAIQENKKGCIPSPVHLKMVQNKESS